MTFGQDLLYRQRTPLVRRRDQDTLAFHPGHGNNTSRQQSRLAITDPPLLVDPNDSTANLADRARAYLHVN